MADSKDSRPLTLVKEFNSAAADKQWGYQKIDDLTVVERKALPAMAVSGYNSQWNLMLTVYDFNKYEVTTIIQPFKQDSALVLPPTVKNFSEVEGKQSIRDAHRALTELGGAPPPLDEIMGYVMELKGAVQVLPTLKLKSGA